MAFIVDADNKLTGVLTDGDIRRFMLQGQALEGDIEKIMTENFVYAYDTEPYNEMLGKLSSKIKILPIVNQDFVVKDFFEYHTQVHIPVASPNLIGNEINYLMDEYTKRSRHE